jgi:hypothetical protein
MSSNGDRTSIDEELRDIEATLRALTLQVATLRANGSHPSCGGAAARRHGSATLQPQYM